MKGSQIGTAAVLFSVGLLAANGLVAQDKNAPSDAQVEANVLKALANAPELSAQNIQTSTTYGVVTISGNVHDETARTKAENLIARAPGVKKVVDELTLGDTPAETAQVDSYGNPVESGQVTAGPESANMASPDAGYPQDQGSGQGNYPPQGNTHGAPPPPPNGNYGPPNAGYGQPNGNAPAYAGGPPPAGQPGYGPNYGPNYGPQGAPPNYNGQPDARQPMYPPAGYARRGPGAGQQAGIPVMVPAGAPLRVRINRGIDSQHIRPGTPFDGTVMTDIVSDGAVAIPRGAMVQGIVVDAAKTKELSGRGELALQITGVTLGGQFYPIQSDVWHRVGADKTARTVDHAVGLGILGAVIGGVAGGGAGAAIGAGVGAGAGVASSAGSPGGHIIVPPESVLNFVVQTPVQVRTVSEQEMARMSYNAGPGQPARVVYRRPGYYPYGGVYYYGR